MWFEDLMGFVEVSHDNVHKNIILDDQVLVSNVNGRKFQYGNLEIISVKELRERVRPNKGQTKLSLGEKVGDVKTLHKDIRNENAVFQAASQFNLLEMVSPSVSPEEGIANYQLDRTQGPACAVACGAGTIYRNYFVNVNGQKGQTRNNQIDCLEDIGVALNNEKLKLWTMQNGYAFPSLGGIEYINNYLDKISITEYDDILNKLKVGIQWNSEVTISKHKHTVNQVYSSALPVAYSQLDSNLFQSFAQMILDATYEATLLSAIHNLQTSGNNKLYLTLVGGGVFGNQLSWIFSAIRKNILRYKDYPLDIKIVSFGSSNPNVLEFCHILNNEL